MSEILLVAAAGASGLCVLLLLAVLLRVRSGESQPLAADLRALHGNQDRGLRSLFDELRASRREALEAAGGQRAELAARIKDSGDAMLRALETITALQGEQLSKLAAGQAELARGSEARAEHLRESAEASWKQFREEQLRGTERVHAAVGASAASLREEFGTSLRSLHEALVATQHAVADLHKGHLESFSLQISALVTANQKNFESLREAVQDRLARIQADNERRLEQIRETVDEKLQGTLERRLGESFRSVSERLEHVRQGLGEMQTLASGVGDLKRLLHHVRTRGSWGEVQLGRLLADVLAPDQYAERVTTHAGSARPAPFAIKLPGRSGVGGEPLWLPLDARFHREEYERIAQCAESGDPAAVEAAARELEVQLRAAAAELAGQLLCPPHTTDFGILFVPTEGLFAELIRRPGLVEELQREQRVVLAGPTTLAALLSSLHIGFRTLALQRRTGEVWEVLGAVKTEFEKFGGVMEKVHRKLAEASSVVEQAQSRSRAVERKLRDVERLPEAEANVLLGGGGVSEAEA